MPSRRFHRLGGGTDGWRTKLLDTTDSFLAQPQCSSSQEPDLTDWGVPSGRGRRDGAPWVDESAAVEFALAVGVKHEPGIRYLGDAMELCHRLPRGADRRDEGGCW